MTTRKGLGIHDVTHLNDPNQYRILVGALQYCSLTQLDIAFSVNKLYQFLSSPIETYTLALKRLLRYLIGTISHDLCFAKSNNLCLKAYYDTNWASSIDNLCSIGAYCVFLRDSLTSWYTSKQKDVAHSSIEFEYHVMISTAVELQ